MRSLISLLVCVVFFNNYSFSQSLVSVQPDSAYLGQHGQQITILGSGTQFTQGSKTIWFTQGSTTIYTHSTYAFTDTEMITYRTVPYWVDTGMYDMHVSTTVQGVFHLNNALYVYSRNPSLKTISPVSANQGQLFSMTIHGSKTLFKQASNTVYLEQGGIQIVNNNNLAVNDSELVADFFVPVGAMPGSWDVVVNTSTQGKLTISNGFQINQSTILIDRVYPDTINQGTTTSVVLHGTGTAFAHGSSAPQVWFTQGSSTLNMTGENALNDTMITGFLNVPGNAVTGNWTVHVQDPLHLHLSKSNGVYIGLSQTTNPTLQSILPDTLELGGTESVLITGMGTSFTQASNTLVWLQQGNSTIQASNTVALTNTQLSAQFNVPGSAAWGSYDLYVYNSLDDTLMLNNAVYLIPDLTMLISITPNKAKQGDSLEVTITASNSSFSQSVNAVGLTKGTDVINATSVNALSDTELKANIKIPASAGTGLWDLHVVNLVDGTIAMPKGFTVDPAVGLRETVVEPDGIVLYPNPTSDKLIIDFDLNPSEVTKLAVFNVLGDQVINLGHSLPANSPLTIDLSQYALEQGTYFLKVETPSTSTVKKFIYMK